MSQRSLSSDDFASIIAILEQLSQQKIGQKYSISQSILSHLESLSINWWSTLTNDQNTG